MILAIDPGTRLCGYASFFYDGRPFEAGIVRSKCTNLLDRAEEMGGQLWLIGLKACHEDSLRLVIERPVIYPGSRERDSDIIGLMLTAGYLAGYLAGVHDAATIMPTPREWKGTMPKHIHHDRLRAQCSEAIPIVERDTPKSMQNHVWDAVGLALWQLERTK